MNHRRLKCGPLLGLIFIGLAATGSRAQSESAPLEVERLIFILQYIGADYGLAVRDGSVINAFEYQEMVAFSRLLVDRCDVLIRRGAAADTCASLSQLSDRIRELRPWNEIRAEVVELASRLVDELRVVALPVESPDPRRGEDLYASNCAPCHGPSGGGDGFADPEMDPPPGSFREPRMNLLSPHQIQGAIRFGIQGTAMPSYADALSDREMWDIAFFLLTLRDDFDPAGRDPGLGLSLHELITRSNDELDRLLRGRGTRAQPSELDYLRWKPPPSHPAAPVSTSSVDRASPVLAPSEIGDSSGFELALRLQETFAAVADRVLPGVVSVTAFVRDSAEAVEPAEDWQIGGSEERLYPGFRRLATGSGFFVSEDGYVLTVAHPLMREDGSVAEVVDVELPNGKHVLSRIVGTEMTINLAVVQLEVVPQHRPLNIEPVTVGDSDAVEVGHWTIAVGDPWGPERTYTVGTLSAQPRRQCYQGDFSGTLMQSSVRVHRESYGGPLVNIRGEVIGMNVPPPGGSPLVPRASEFALPSNLAMNIYQALRIAESRRSPWLGISVLELAAVRRRHREAGAIPLLPRTGVFIDDRFDPSPATREDIRVGDSLVSIDGNRLLSVLDFQKWLYLSGVGRKVVLEVFREGEILKKSVTIEERPAAAVAR